MQPAIELQQSLLKRLVLKNKNTNCSLPDEQCQTAVDEWVDGKLGEAIRAPYPERNELVQDLRDEMEEHFDRATWRR